MEAMIPATRACQGAQGCRCQLHIDQTTGAAVYDASECVLHAQRAEQDARLGRSLAGWADGVCVFCQRGGEMGMPSRSIDPA